MNDNQRQLLALMAQPPARLTPEQVAGVLNCQPLDIGILVTARLLKPLGNPPANGQKFFSAADVKALSGDTAWLARMTNAIHHHWRVKNERKKDRFPDRAKRSTPPGQSPTDPLAR